MAHTHAKFTTGEGESVFLANDTLVRTKHGTEKPAGDCHPAELVFVPVERKTTVIVGKGIKSRPMFTTETVPVRAMRDDADWARALHQRGLGMRAESEAFLPSKRDAKIAEEKRQWATMEIEVRPGFVIFLDGTVVGRPEEKIPRGGSEDRSAKTLYVITPASKTREKRGYVRLLRAAEGGVKIKITDGDKPRGRKLAKAAAALVADDLEIPAVPADRTVLCTKAQEPDVRKYLIEHFTRLGYDYVEARRG